MGLSLLDSVIHARAASGFVQPCFTRLLLSIYFLDKGTGTKRSAEISSMLANGEVSGMGILQSNSLWVIIEAAPELCVEFLRKIQNDYFNPSGPHYKKLKDARIVAQIEDCPARIFGLFSVLNFELPSEANYKIDDSEVVQLASETYTQILDLGRTIQDQINSADPHGPHPPVEEIIKSNGSFLPSNDKVVALSRCSKLPRISDWLAIYDAPLEWELPNDEVFPPLPY